jgi:hypothetical protein
MSMYSLLSSTMLIMRDWKRKILTAGEVFHNTTTSAPHRPLRRRWLWPPPLAPWELTRGPDPVRRPLRRRGWPQRPRRSLSTGHERPTTRTALGAPPPTTATPRRFSQWRRLPPLREARGLTSPPPPGALRGPDSGWPRPLRRWPPPSPHTRLSQDLGLPRL